WIIVSPISIFRINEKLQWAKQTKVHIENAFDGKIQQKHGIFLSSKRNENGIGIQSVRHIVEKTGGGCDFTYDNGIFTAKIMLRPCINS
ncbi:GHKL domain-containing protein, partial [Dorea longicatena]